MIGNENQNVKNEMRPRSAHATELQIQILRAQYTILWEKIPFNKSIELCYTLYFKHLSFLYQMPQN